MCVLGMAGELADSSVAVNALWPRTSIDTAAVQNLLGGGEVVQHSRLPTIMADSAWCVCNQLAYPSAPMSPLIARQARAHAPAEDLHRQLFY